MIRLRLKEILATNKMTGLADFELKNNWIAREESWKAEPLPQTRRDGEFEFTLLALNTGLTATGTMRQMNMNEVWSEAVFRIGTNEPAVRGTNGLPAGDWKIGPLTLRDATGNEILIREPQGRVVQQVGKLVWWRYDDGVANIPDALWPEETWKLHASFTLTSGAELPPEQLWRLKELQLPAAGQTITFNTNAQLFGADVTLISITATNPAEPGPKLHFKFQPPDDRYELRVRATDQRGTNVFAQRDLKYGFRKWAFQLKPRPGAETMNLTLGVTRRYSAEFLVRPALLRTNLAHWPTQ